MVVVPKDVTSGLTQNYLRQLLDYNPDTGIFRWSKNICRPRCTPGAVAGCLRPDKRWMIRIDGILYNAHRLAWIYMTGVSPSNEIDHINRVRNDNRWCNLREATRSQNQLNVPRQNATGFMRVDYINGRYRARVRIDGKSKHLCMRDTAEEANAAAAAVMKQLYGDFVVV